MNEDNKHNWIAVSVGLYDSTYQCTLCDKLHTEQADTPIETARPLYGCAGVKDIPSPITTKCICGFDRRHDPDHANFCPRSTSYIKPKTESDCTCSFNIQAGDTHHAPSCPISKAVVRLSKCICGCDEIKTRSKHLSYCPRYIPVADGHYLHLPDNSVVGREDKIKCPKHDTGGGPCYCLKVCPLHGALAEDGKCDVCEGRGLWEEDEAPSNYIQNEDIHLLETFGKKPEPPYIPPTGYQQISIEKMLALLTKANAPKELKEFLTQLTEKVYSNGTN